MDLGLKGKVAVVTASSKGLGLSIAEALAAEGTNLVLCSRKQEHIDQIGLKLAANYGVETSALQIDVSEPKDLMKLIAHTMDKFGRVDALVCNAGGPPSGSFLTIDDQQWERAFQTNLMSIVRLIRGFYPLLRESQGKVITLASTSVKVPIPGLVLSNTFRAGVAGLMKTLSIELAPDNILLNTLCPGRISTDR
jgi:3-oxoacyl-[acyl-carrier protein] reductase